MQGEGNGKVHGYDAFAYSAFSTYHGNLVFNFAHSISKDLLLFPQLLPEYGGGARVFGRAHGGTKLKTRF
jgi:hypothetical protein